MPGALIPLAGLIRRDLLRNLRRTRVYVATAIFLLVIAYLTLRAWPQGSIPVTDANAFGRDFVDMVLFWAKVFAIAVLPGHAALAIRAERDRDTFDLMQATLLTPPMLLVGIVANSTCIYLLTTFAALPLLTAASFVIALPIHILLLRLSVVISLALLCAACGLYAATHQNTTWSAIFSGSAVALLAASGLIAFPVTMIWRILIDTGVIGTAAVSPVQLHWLLLPFSDMDNFGPRPNAPMGGHEVALHCLVSSTYLTLSAVILQLSAWRRLTRETTVTSFATMPREALRHTLSASISVPTKFDPIPDHANPIVTRELLALRRHPDRLKWTLGTLAFVVVGAFFAFQISDPYVGLFGSGSTQRARGLVYLFQFATVAVSLCVTGIAVSLASRENDVDTEGMLDMTLLTPRERAWGRMALPVYLSFLVILAVTTAISPALRFAFGTIHGLWLLLFGGAAMLSTAMLLATGCRHLLRFPMESATRLIVAQVIALACLLLPLALLGPSASSRIMLWINTIFPLNAVSIACHPLDYFETTLDRAHISTPLYFAVFVLVQTCLIALCAGDGLWQRRLGTPRPNRRERRHA